MTTGDGYTCVNCGQYVWWNQIHQCPAWTYSPYKTWPVTENPVPNYYGSNMLIIQLTDDRREARMWAKIMLNRWIEAERRVTEQKGTIGEMLGAMRAYHDGVRTAERDLKDAQSVLCMWVDYCNKHFPDKVDDEMKHLLFMTGAAVAAKPS